MEKLTSSVRTLLGRIIAKENREHIIPILFIFLYGLIFNLIGLRDFFPQLAWWGDDNCAYYAERAVLREIYPGDIWHNSFQKEYIWLSSPHWISSFLFRFPGIPTPTMALIFTALKVWLLTYSCYLLAFKLLQKQWSAAVVAIGVNSSYVMWHNLGGFSYWYFIPYQSDLAYSFVLLTIYFVIENRIGIAIISATIASTIQPSIGIYGMFILLVLLVGEWRSAPLGKRFLQIIGMIPLCVIILLPAHLVLNKIPKESFGSAKLIYDALNGTHGGQWEWAGGVWWNKLHAIILNLLLLLPVFMSRLFSENRAYKVLNLSLLASVILVMLGIGAKKACIYLSNTPWLKYAVPFHQLLMTRASVFLLIIALIITLAWLIERLSHREPAIRILALLTLFLLVDMNHQVMITFRLYPRIHLALAIIFLCFEILEKRITIFTYAVKAFNTILKLVISVLFCFLIYLTILYNIFPLPRGTLYLLLPLSFILFLMFLEIRNHGIRKILPCLYAAYVFIMLILLWRSSYSEFLANNVLFANLIFFFFTPLFILIPNPGRIDTDYIRRPAGLDPITVLIVFICIISINFANHAYRPSALGNDWYEASIWARNNTTPSSSFLILTDSSGIANEDGYPPEGWRTFSRRGKIKLFDSPIMLVYTPDLRFEDCMRPLIEYWKTKYPNLSNNEILLRLDDSDIEWLGRQTGATYAIAPSMIQFRFHRSAIFSNNSFAIYDITHIETRDLEEDSARIIDWIQRNAPEAKTAWISESPYPELKDRMNVEIKHGLIPIADFALKQPDLFIFSESYMAQIQSRLQKEASKGIKKQSSWNKSSRFYEALQKGSRFLNYEKAGLVRLSAGSAGRNLTIYKCSRCRPLKGLIQEYSGSPLFPSPHGIDILELEEEDIPDSMYLAVIGKSPLPNILDLRLKSEISLQGAKLVWLSRENHPTGAKLTGWLDDQEVFEQELPVEIPEPYSGMDTPYSWMELDENRQVNRLTLSVSKFKGQKRLLLRRFLLE